MAFKKTNEAVKRNSGYAFVKWSDNDTNSTRAIANVASDITLSAEFEAIEPGGPYDCAL